MQLFDEVDDDELDIVQLALMLEDEVVPVESYVEWLAFDEISILLYDNDELETLIDKTNVDEQTDETPIFEKKLHIDDDCDDELDAKVEVDEVVDDII